MTPTRPVFPAVVHAPAKVNLFLHITGKRDDGYHTLESGVVFTAFGDRITIDRAAADEICIIGPFANDLNEYTSINVCLTCLEEFRRAGGTFEPVMVKIEKNIPVGAGLGGGSADAAALLRYINQHTPSPLPYSALQELALRLGADVPACLNMSPTLVEGVGEIISPLKIRNPGPILLANPGKVLFTKDVFRAYSEGYENFRSGQEPKPNQNWMGPATLAQLGNDLQKAARHLMPQVSDLMIKMNKQDGAIAVGLSGSGATCFAIYENEKKCVASASSLRELGFWSEATLIV